jgi:predicted DNA-binding protein (UPF0278 family)
MRDCGLWITPWVDRNQEIILDTSALTESEWRAVVHNDPDSPPKDTVLVLIHPARYMDLKIAVAEMNPLTFMDFADPNGRNVAAHLIEKECHRDPELRRRLRW